MTESRRRETPTPRKPAKARAPQQLPPIVRDVAILVLGVFGFLHEILSAKPEPMFVFASLAALGLPIAFRADERGM